MRPTARFVEIKSSITAGARAHEIISFFVLFFAFTRRWVDTAQRKTPLGTRQGENVPYPGDKPGDDETSRYGLFITYLFI